MFTGIVEELGKIKKITRGSTRQSIAISCSKVLGDIHTGDSIAVNGVCLTAADYGEDYFIADVMNETFSRSALGSLTVGSLVDLERAMPSNGRFGGHIVSGHIDGIGKIKSVRQDGNAIWFEIGAARNILDGIVEKGSIAIDGISLTVALVSADSFKVSIIPHTLQETVLGHRKIGDVVNLENDVIGKYVKKFMECKDSTGITREFLLANGF